MGGGGHDSTTNNINNKSTTTVDQHDKNTENNNTHFDITKDDTTTVNGNVSSGRSVTMDGTGNNGLQCFGMAAGDPRCHTLMNLKASGYHGAVLLI